ncbi:Glutamine amidotransferases class-II [Rhizoctonia solani]|uniref:Phosphatidylglycerol/phosphatidylinositol transfer protein n=1 Tax=Rhizoctonia solani TaxID=456999 RepID=A0A8H7IEW3_9AGAM|nr:Glutamine amidotransferases class-II [Rhizoctonia solani]
MVRKWIPDTQFNRGAVVRFNNLFYRSSVSHTSGPGREPTEAPQLWAALNNESAPPAAPDPPQSYENPPPMYVHPESGASTTTVNSIPPPPPHVPGYGFYTYLPAGHHPTQYHLPSGYRPLYNAPQAPYLHAPKPQHPIRPPDPDVKLPLPVTQAQSQSRSDRASPDYVLPMPFPFSRFIEGPTHPAYRTLAHAMRALETNEAVLREEMKGEIDAVCCVGGFGLWAYRHGEPGEDVKRRVYAELQSDDDTGREAWLKAAEHGPSATPHPEAENMTPAALERHALQHGSFPRIPDDALQTGTEVSGTGLYSARAWHAGGVHLGKAGKHLQAGGASLSYGSIEHELSSFEVLVGDVASVRWIEGSQLASQLAAGVIPVEGGREAHGGAILIAQAPYEGGWHPGKAAIGEDHACVGFGGANFGRADIASTPFRKAYTWATRQANGLPEAALGRHSQPSREFDCETSERALFAGLFPHKSAEEDKKQEAESAIRNAHFNNDGTGVAFYNKTMQDYGEAKSIYKTIIAPTNDVNFQSLCRNTSSRTVFAHVRMATSEVQQFNSHPFAFGRHIFMHNGSVANFSSIRRDLCAKLSTRAYNNIKGSTDSEHLAALYMTHLGDDWTVHTPTETPDATTPLAASSLNVCTTDGEELLAFRFRSSEVEQPPSLYYSTSAGVTLNRKYPGHPNYFKWEDPGDAATGLVGPDELRPEAYGNHVIVASEPTTKDEGEWERVPKNKAVMVDFPRGENRVQFLCDASVISVDWPPRLLPSATTYLTTPAHLHSRIMYFPKVALLAASLSPFAASALSFTRPDLVLNGESPIFTQSRWSWTDCGLPSDGVQIKSIEVSPDPPKPGQDLTVTVIATADQPIEEGAYADVTVKLGLIKLLNKRFDICEEARNANATIQCPVQKGDHTVVQTVALPKEIPRGMLSPANQPDIETNSDVQPNLQST